ncbi:hypothetical protein [Pseudomonas fluorescens]|uniref:hypothetical protein n=1 Tax=Pseudomonas fluorescens TaxID=294 RepID=UPI0014317D0E|nr:hypothetical protein [Pseudomonas fluorescens]
MSTQSAGDSSDRVAGEQDWKFGTDGYIQFDGRGSVNSLTHDRESKLIFALQLEDRFALTRYLQHGTKDEEFREIGWNFRDGDKSVPTRVLLQEDEKILLIGASSKAGTREWNPAAVRFLANGGHDIVFGRRILPGPINGNYAELRNYKTVDGCLQKDQKILICATYYLRYDEENPEATLSRLFRLQPNGELDSGFGAGRGFIDIRLHDQASYVCNVGVQSDSKIIVAGSWRYLDEQPRTRTVARYMPTGELDLSFGSGGFADIVVEENTAQLLPAERFQPNIVTRVLVQDDDKILVAGYANAPDDLQSGLLVRLQANGEKDGSFNNGEPLLISRTLNALSHSSMALQPDGKVVVVGTAVSAGVNLRQYERVTQNGQLDGFFRAQSPGDCADVTIQPLGRVVIAGSSNRLNPTVWGYVGS